MCLWLARLRRCASDEAGVTAVEFAIVTPVFLALLLGIFDFGHMIYAQAVLQGAVQQAGRNSGLEAGASQMTRLDEDVRSQIGNIVPQGSVLTSRKNYENFSVVTKPEDFVDADKDGIYSEDECFTDVNANGQWDEDRGIEGLGGADDVVLYTATLRYERIVPLNLIIGGDNTRTVTASTTLRSQPFGAQAERPEVQICPE